MGEKEQKQQLHKVQKSSGAILILHNDDVNDFDYVIDMLIEVCDHEEAQAEQCAMIAHFKGKCDVKKGEKRMIEHKKSLLIERGLIATVEY